MSAAVSKAELFERLGYRAPYDLLEAALEEAGLSRPDKANIAERKLEDVRDVLAERFIIVCSRGDCQHASGGVAGGRTSVRAAVQEECAVCGGSATARAVERLVSAMAQAGLSRLCVVGGSPNLRVELDRSVG